MSKLEDIRTHALSLIEGVSDLLVLDNARTKILGRKSELSLFLRSLKDMPPENQRGVGAAANALRAELEELFEEKRRELSAASYESVLKGERIDVTRPGLKHARGHIHPISRVIKDIVSIFSSMGFEVVEGPEVETEYYNFDALNIPANHPARDMWDTFWLKPKNAGHLLRTHTSPVQIRYMEKHNPPLRIIAPGRIFRYEATDASHGFNFYQLEGLMVGKEVSVANFKAIIEEFYRQFFGKPVAIRLRTSYFPFTEPSFEVDMRWNKGAWLEMMGAGIVHPNVFRA